VSLSVSRNLAELRTSCGTAREWMDHSDRIAGNVLSNQFVETSHEGRNISINMGDNERSKSRISRSTNIWTLLQYRTIKSTCLKICSEKQRRKRRREQFCHVRKRHMTTAQRNMFVVKLWGIHVAKSCNMKRTDHL
jgi:hypothetical protein